MEMRRDRDRNNENKSNDGSENSDESHHDKIISLLNDIKEVINGDSKEMQKILNFSRDIHLKVQQLPHKMAHKKDISQFEQSIYKHLKSFITNNPNLSQLPQQQIQTQTQGQAPISSSISPNKSTNNWMSMNNISMLSCDVSAIMPPQRPTTTGSKQIQTQNQQEMSNTNNNMVMMDVIDQFMGLMMMKFDIWLKDIEHGLQQKRYNVYTIMNVLSTIICSRIYYFHPTKSEQGADGQQKQEKRDGEEKDEEEEKYQQQGNNDDENKKILNTNAFIRGKAMNLMNLIESALENDEYDSEIICNKFAQYINDIRNNPLKEERDYVGIDNLWILQQGQGMEYICNQELRIHQRLNHLKENIDKMIIKQKSICGQKCFFNLFAGGITITVILFGLLIQKLISQGNMNF